MSKTNVKTRIYEWFVAHNNKLATLKEVQAAFPEINPKTISGTLSGKDSNGDYNFEVSCELSCVSGNRPYHYKMYDSDYDSYKNSVAAQQKTTSNSKVDHTYEIVVSLLKSIDKKLSSIDKRLSDLVDLNR